LHSGLELVNHEYKEELLGKGNVNDTYHCSVKEYFEDSRLPKEVMNPPLPRKFLKTPLKSLQNKPRILGK
jgi:hypothetical protein